MSYVGTRRPTLLSRFASWAGSWVAAGVLAWFAIRYLGPVLDEGLVTFVAQALGCIVVAVVIHECGHLLMGVALGEPVRKIRIGSGPTVVGFRVAGITVQICLVPIAGGAVYISRIGLGSRAAQVATFAAGPVVNLIALIYAFPFFQSGVTWLGTFVLANLLAFVSTVTPSAERSGGQVSYSDGLQILRLLFRPPVPRKVYEGGEMTDDAYAVLAHAGEDAQLNGSHEITDEDLLRALDLDPTVGALFKATGLHDHIPPARLPEAADDTAVKASKTMHDVLTASVRKCRDLGIAKPSPASFCLGLLVVECPAGRLMKQAGITEDMVRNLIVAAPDADDQQRARVISADLPLERWGTTADAVLAQATRLAVADRSPMVSTQHLVAAIASLPATRGGLVLQRLGFVVDWKKSEREAGDPAATEGDPILSPQAGLALAGALWRTGANSWTGTAEILLGIVDQEAGLGAQMLLSAGIGPREIEKALRFTEREAGEHAGCTAASRGLWMLRGSARVGAEHWLDARADFLAAEPTAASDLQRALCHNNVAWVLLMAGDPALYAEALERSRKAVAIKPDQPAFMSTNAFAMLENGLAADAAPILEAVIPRHGRPRSIASDLCVLAICRARLGQPELASKLIADAAAADPKCALLGRARAEVEKAGALSSPRV